MTTGEGKVTQFWTANGPGVKDSFIDSKRSNQRKNIVEAGIKKNKTPNLRLTTGKSNLTSIHLRELISKHPSEKKVRRIPDFDISDSSRKSYWKEEVEERRDRNI